MGTVDQAVGENLKRLRLERRLSQEALARSVRIEPAELRGFEAGHARLASLTLCLLARTMEVPVSAFFSELPLIMQNPPIGQSSLTAS